MDKGNNQQGDCLQEPFSRIAYKMHLLLQVGKALMESGADTDRTVRDMRRAAAYMGIPQERIHQHTMYTTLMLNVNDDQHSYTEFCKCKNHGVNMTTLSAVSKLTWKALARNYTLESFERHLLRIHGIPRDYTVGQTALGAGAACGGFAVLFGGSLLDFLLTAVCACFGFYVRRLCNAYAFNQYAAIAITAFAATMLAWAAQFPLGELHWYPLIACPLFLVPGIPLINAIDDFLNNFIVSGLTRAIHTLLVVGSMTFGIVLAIRLGNVADFTEVSLSPHSLYFAQAIAAAISAMGFSIIFNVPRRLLPVVGVGGVITVMLRNFCVMELGTSQAFGSFLGAAVVGVMALKAIHVFHTPNVVLTIPSAIPMIPGVLLYRLLFVLLNISTITPAALLDGLRSGVEAIIIIIGIAVGVAIPNIFNHRHIETVKQKRVARLLALRDED